jgi:hypothetical protein
MGFIMDTPSISLATEFKKTPDEQQSDRSPNGINPDVKKQLAEFGPLALKTLLSMRRHEKARINHFPVEPK